MPRRVDPAIKAKAIEMREAGKSGGEGCVKIATHRVRIHTIKRYGFAALLRPFTFQARCDSCEWTGETWPGYWQARGEGLRHEQSTGREVELDPARFPEAEAA